MTKDEMIRSPHSVAPHLNSPRHSPRHRHPCPLATMSGIESRLFINNEYVPAIGGETFDVVNPTTEKLVTKVQAAQPADVDKAVRALAK
jgi:hypothetical protein